MGLETEIIRYNLHDRRRKHVGQTRHFNTAKLAAIVNGVRIQEMVKKGDLVGYLGHDVRRQFGLNPPEAAIENGQFVPIEPAFVTTYIKIHDDGTVEHKARFLDTPLGIKAQEWHLAGLGGFSSVVAPDEENPRDFHGFDYVRSPNFHGNRGYAVMDDTAYSTELNRLTSKQKFHELQARQMEQQAVMDALFQTVQHIPQMAQQHQQLLATIDSLAAQLDDTQRERDEIQAICDELQPKFAPMVRLSASNNWLQQSMSVMDDIRNANVKEINNPEEDAAYQRTLNYLRSRQNG